MSRQVRDIVNGTHRNLKLTATQAAELEMILAHELATMEGDLSDEGDVEFRQHMKRSIAITRTILAKLNGVTK